MALSPHRQLVEAFVSEHCDPDKLWHVVAGHMRKTGRWLDLGGGAREPRAADVSLDLTFCPIQPRHPVVGTAERLPFRDGTFAVVTAIEMLYLVADLEAALEEIRRVLKTGGKLVATCPFSKPSNEPGDWRRPTAHAWAWMLEHARFAEWHVVPLGGPYSVLWQAGYAITAGRGSRRVLAALAARTAPAGRWLDRRSGAAWPLGYGVVATR